MASSQSRTKSPKTSWTDTECYYGVVERILKEASPAFLMKFESLNSNKDRFSFVDSNKKITELLSTQIRNINVLNLKSDQAAELHRSKGNNFFKSGEFLKALEEYNKCIVYSRTDQLEEYKRKLINNTSDSFENSSLENSGRKNSSELALGLGNRSVVLLKLSRFNECIDDVKDSLDSGYPSTQKYKLLERIAACQEQLGNLCSAVEYFQMAKKAIELSDLTETQRTAQEKLIETNIYRCNKKKNDLKSQQNLANSENCSSCKETERNCVKLKSDQGPEQKNAKVDLIKSLQRENPLPKLSDGSIRFEYSSEVGKHAVASRDIQTGEVVMIDETFAKVLTQSDMEDHCYYCFSKLSLQWDRIYPCFTCVFARYCSKNCRRLSYLLHRHDLECPLLSKWFYSKTGPMTWLVVRLILSIGKDKWMDILQLLNMIDSKNNFDKHSRQEDCSDLLVSESLEFDDIFRKVAFEKNVLSLAPKLYNLVSHSDKRQPAELLQYSLLALWTVLLLDEIKFFEDIQIPEENSKLTNDKISTKEMKSHQSRTIIGGMALKFVQIISCNGIEITSMSLNDTLSKCHPQCIGVALYPKVSLFNHSCDPDIELLFVKDVCVARSLRPISKGSPVNIDYGFLFYSSPKRIRQDHLMRQYFFQCQCRACYNNWNVKKDLLKDSDIFQPVVMTEDKSKTQCPICFAHSVEDLFKEIEKANLNSNVDMSGSDVKEEEIQKKSKRRRRKKTTSNSDMKTSDNNLLRESKERPQHESIYESEKCQERHELCKCVSCEMMSYKSTVELLKSMNCKLEDVLRNVGKMNISSNDIKYLEVYLDVRYFSSPKYITQELVSCTSTLKQIYRLLGNNKK